jgi:hypothetical protein
MTVVLSLPKIFDFTSSHYTNFYTRWNGSKWHRIWWCNGKVFVVNSDKRLDSDSEFWELVNNSWLFSEDYALLVCFKQYFIKEYKYSVWIFCYLYPVPTTVYNKFWKTWTEIATYFPPLLIRVSCISHAHAEGVILFLNGNVISVRCGKRQSWHGGEWKYSSIIFDLGSRLMCMLSFTSRPFPHPPGGNSRRYPLDRRLDRLQNRPGRPAGNRVPPDHPLALCCTHWTIPTIPTPYVKEAAWTTQG